MQSDRLVKYLDWDSEFFSLRIAHVEGKSLDTISLRQIDIWCRDNRIDCLYFLADPSDTESIRLAEKGGFHLVDLRVTLELKITPLTPPWLPLSSTVRQATSEDIGALRTIASTNHRDSRFYQDGGFSSKQCDELYATWIEKSCTGYAHMVLVADCGAGAVGYLSCHIREGETGQIGLLGVSSKCQGAGLGKLLMEESLRWFAISGMKRVEVVTQGRNVAAQRLYQKNGFLTQSLGLWYHRWYLKNTS